MRHDVFLIPGFFGFANLSDLVYFEHVRAFFEARGRLDVRVWDVESHPTASLRTRARRLVDAIATRAGDGDIHLVGHSSGGLDARLLTSPGVDLGGGVAVEPWASRVKTVLTVATPHRGTPSARLFATLFGRQLLQALSVATLYVLRYGSLPLSIVAAFLRALDRVDERLGTRATVLDDVVVQILRGFDPVRRAAIEAFMADVGDDQGLLSQLSPEAMDGLGAAMVDRPGVRYGSIVTRGRRPGLGTAWAAGPLAQHSHAIYAALHEISSRSAPGDYPLPPDVERALTLAFGEAPTPRSNDGMVPTRSQVHGDLVAAAWADHLDILGHFDAPETIPPHYDWLTSGTGFGRGEFEATWNAAFQFLSLG